MASAELREWAGLTAASDRPFVYSPGHRPAGEVIEMAKELKRLGVKHFKDDTMELSFEREMKRGHDDG